LLRQRREIRNTGTEWNEEWGYWIEIDSAPFSARNSSVALSWALPQASPFRAFDAFFSLATRAGSQALALVIVHATRFGRCLGRDIVRLPS
jgi:hypothetical protein